MAPTVETRASAPTRLERVGQVAARVGSLRPADPRVRRGVHAAIATVLIASAALALAAAVGDFPEVDWRFRPVALGLALIGFAVSLLAAAELWRRVLGSLGPTLEPRRSAAIWFVSGLGRYVPTSLLLPMLRTAMAERDGVPGRISLASMAYEACLSSTAALIIAAYFVIDLPDLSSSPGRFLVVVLPVAALVLMQPRFFHTVADKVLIRLGRAPLPLSLSSGRVLLLVCLYAVTYVVAGLSLYALAQSIYPVGSGDLILVIGAFSVGTALSLIAFALPGGLVAREAGIALALSPVMPAAPAIAIAVLSRIIQLGLELLGAVIGPIVARRAKGLIPDGTGPNGSAR
jgi:glycosyltransferase 2 family protein